MKSHGRRRDALLSKGTPPTLTFTSGRRSVPPFVNVTDQFRSTDKRVSRLALVPDDAQVMPRFVDEVIATIPDGRWQAALQIWDGKEGICKGKNF